MFGQDSQNNVGVIQAATVFGEVDFLYVGAALCVGILDQHGNLAAIFDLGTRVSNNPALAAQHPAAANSRAVIMAALNAIAPNNRQTIFISHWHTDHCNALGGLAHQGGFGNANFNQNSEWYVPASGSISYTTVQNAIPAASFHVFAQGVIQPTAAVNGNVNISVGKISLQNNAHPHHQGLYVKLQLTSGTDVFLAGDTTYEGIPAATRTNGGAGYDVLQACHHGGAYYLPPANQNAAVAQGNIPTAANGATVVYSADGIYHGHPNAVYMGHHQNQGYAAAVRLDQIALTGNNVQFFQ